jgi:hypothetical protein
LDPQEKAYLKRKKRIKYITQRINDMKKKRTFMTAPDMVVEEEDIEEPPPKEEEPDIFEEYNAMLMDICSVQKKV